MHRHKAELIVFRNLERHDEHCLVSRSPKQQLEVSMDLACHSIWISLCDCYCRESSRGKMQAGEILGAGSMFYSFESLQRVVATHGSIPTPGAQRVVLFVLKIRTTRLSR